MASDEPQGPNLEPSHPLRESADELADFVFRLMTRSNNIERHAGKLEDWYYRLHGQLKAVENSVESLNKWRGRMEAQQAALSSLIRFGTSTWAYEGWQGIVYHQSYEKRRF